MLCGPGRVSSKEPTTLPKSFSYSTSSRFAKDLTTISKLHIDGDESRLTACHEIVYLLI